MLKRIFAFCLILALTASLINVLPVSAASEERIQLVADLGIIDISGNTGLIPAGYNRSDFARSLCLMERNDSLISTVEVEKYASDIAADKNSGYIAAVLSAGYMSTDGEGKFNPGVSVSMEDAVIALVKMLGYEPMAASYGGTYEAYYKIALKIGLMRGVNIQNSEKLTAKETAEMLTNTMGANMFLPDNIDYGEDCLWDRWNLSENTGKILANSNMGLLVERTDCNRINIDGEIYYTKLLIENELVGSNVTYYLMDRGMGDEVVSISVKNYSDTVTLKANEIESISDNGNVLTIKTESKKTLKVDRKGFLIINGKTMTPSMALFKAFESGTATFVDSDNNGIYDVVHMTLLFQTVIDGVNNGSETLATRYDNQSIKLEKIDNYEVYLGKKAAALSDLKPGMPIGIATDSFTVKDGKLVPGFADAEYIRLYASNRQSTGYITALLDDDKLEIEEMTKRFGSGYKRLVKEKHIPALKLGDYVTAYFDNMGQLTYFEISSEGGLRYGYLVKAAASEGLTRTTEVKILDADGKFNIYAAEKRFVLDGSRVDSGSTTYTVNEENDVDLTKRQLVRYRAEEGILKELDTKIVRSGSENTDTSLDEVLTFDTSIDGNSRRSVRSGSINRQYAFTSDCIMFIDEADTDDTSPSENLFSVQNASVLGNSDYYIGGYDSNSDNEISCVVRYDGYGSTDGGSTTGLSYWSHYCYIIEKIRNTIDKDGNEGWTLTLAGENKQETYFVSADNLKLYITKGIDDWGGESNKVYRQEAADFNKLIHEGDLIRFKTNTAGNINYIEKMFDFESNKNSIAEVVTNKSGQTYAFVKLEKISGSNFIYSYDKGDGIRYISKRVPQHTAVPLYHVSTGEVEMLPFEQIPSASTGNNVKCFIRYYNYGIAYDHIFYIYD